MILTNAIYILGILFNALMHVVNYATIKWMARDKARPSSTPIWFAKQRDYLPGEFLHLTRQHNHIYFTIFKDVELRKKRLVER